MLAVSFKAEAAPVQANLNLAVKSAILVEASSGKILYKYNENQPLPPASMTKMMTEYLVLEAIKKNKIKWDESVPVSEYAFFVAKMSQSAGVYLNMGESHTVKELYKAMAIASANDATVLLAEKVGGSEANFVSMMNAKAKELGMTQTFFATSTGLEADSLGQYSPQTGGKDNVMSARDAAILARALIRDFPESLEYSKIPELVFREGQPNEIRTKNNNWMLPGLPSYYPDIDGLKTGYTSAAMYCFTGTAKRNDMRLISVVMGTDSKLKRFAETKKLMDYGFSNFKLVKVADAGKTIKGYENAAVKKGVDLSVPAVAKSDVMVLTQVGSDAKFVPSVTFKDLTAPVKKGQEIGTVTYQVAGEQAEYLLPSDATGNGVPLVAGKEVEEASWIRLFFRSIIQFFVNIFNNVLG